MSDRPAHHRGFWPKPPNLISIKDRRTAPCERAAATGRHSFRALAARQHVV